MALVRTRKRHLFPNFWQCLESYQSVTLLVLQVIEATRLWTGVRASFAKKTPARNSCVQQTMLMDLKEPDIKLWMERYIAPSTVRPIKLGVP